jgi:hypothetical protein
MLHSYQPLRPGRGGRGHRALPRLARARQDRKLLQVRTLNQTSQMRHWKALISSSGAVTDRSLPLCCFYRPRHKDGVSEGHLCVGLATPARMFNFPSRPRQGSILLCTANITVWIGGAGA